MADCANLDFAQTISTWWSGAKLDGYCIYGQSTVWIGRFAKIIGFLAAIPIIIDIFGEDRVKASSEIAGNILSRISKIFGWLFKLTKTILPGGDSFLFLWRMSFWLTITLTLISVYHGSDSFEIEVDKLQKLVVITIAWFFLPYLVVGPVYALLLISSKILRHHALCVIIRSTSAALLLISFITDLIVSS